MIVDVQSQLSGEVGCLTKILCRCDTCGTDRMVLKYKLKQRHGYRDCQPCSAKKVGEGKRGVKLSIESCKRIAAASLGRRNPHLTETQKQASKRKHLSVQCTGCGQVELRRTDQILKWSGICKNCSSKITASLPHVKEAMRLNGIAVMKRVGKLPHYPDRNYRYGPANNKWRGGITPETQRIRHSLEMKAWRKAVFERDNFTCAVCARRGGYLQADHIKPFALFVELRFDVNNGRTLCVLCHRKFGVCVSGGKITRPAAFAV